MTNKCICGHTQLKHSIRDGAYRCNAKKCNCYKYVSLEDADVKHEETEYEKRLRMAARNKITIKEAGTISSKEEQDIMAFNTDKIRKEHDILVVPEKQLTWYQKVQRDRIQDSMKHFDPEKHKVTVRAIMKELAEKRARGQLI